jgi:hypothetical protein
MAYMHGAAHDSKGTVLAFTRGAQRSAFEPNVSIFATKAAGGGHGCSREGDAVAQDDLRHHHHAFLDVPLEGLGIDPQRLHNAYGCMSDSEYYSQQFSFHRHFCLDLSGRLELPHRAPDTFCQFWNFLVG